MEDDNANFEEQNLMQQSTINNLQHNFTDSSQVASSLEPTAQVQPPVSNTSTDTPIPSTISSSASSPQDSLPNGVTQKMPVDYIANIDKKIKFWKRLSLITGLITFFGYIIVLFSVNVLAHGTQFGWVVFIMFGMTWQGLFFVLFVLSLISLIRVVVLSNKRKKHAFKDYVMVAIGLLLIFSPYVISGVLSFFRISWNEDNSVSVTLKSKDPYYLSGDSSWGELDCTKMQKTGTSNDLKGIDIDDEYSYVESEERRKLFAAEDYMQQIGEEILCQVGEFYKEEGRYPNEIEVESFSSNATNDDVRAGVYNIKLEVGVEPNNKDFTILFDRNCTNKTTKDGNVVVLSPLYGDSGRYCVYQTIDEIRP